MLTEATRNYVLSSFSSSKERMIPILSWHWNGAYNVYSALTVYWSVHSLNNFVYSITGHHQCVMKQDAIDIQTLENIHGKHQQENGNILQS